MLECGITQLGGHANYLTPKATQVDHGETPKDTIEVLWSRAMLRVLETLLLMAINGWLNVEPL